MTASVLNSFIEDPTALNYRLITTGTTLPCWALVTASLSVVPTVLRIVWAFAGQRTPSLFDCLHTRNYSFLAYKDCATALSDGHSLAALTVPETSLHLRMALQTWCPKQHSVPDLVNGGQMGGLNWWLLLPLYAPCCYLSSVPLKMVLSPLLGLRRNKKHPHCHDHAKEEKLPSPHVHARALFAVLLWLVYFNHCSEAKEFV